MQTEVRREEDNHSQYSSEEDIDAQKVRTVAISNNGTRRE
jgi:hypothetical protein